MTPNSLNKQTDLLRRHCHLQGEKGGGHGNRDGATALARFHNPFNFVVLRVAALPEELRNSCGRAPIT